MGRTRFRELGEMYLERVVPLMKSRRSEGIRVAWWVRHFGMRPLGQITRAELETFQREIAIEVSARDREPGVRALASHA